MIMTHDDGSFTTSSDCFVVSSLELVGGTFDVSLFSMIFKQVLIRVSFTVCKSFVASAADFSSISFSFFAFISSSDNGFGLESTSLSLGESSESSLALLSDVSSSFVSPESSRSAASSAAALLLEAIASSSAASFRRFCCCCLLCSREALRRSSVAGDDGGCYNKEERRVNM